MRRFSPHKSAILLLTIFICALVASCDDGSTIVNTPAQSQRTELTIGTTMQTLSANIWLAQEKGYFAENGLQIRVLPTPSGVQAYKELEKGTIDVAAMTALAYVELSLANNDMVILASIATTKNNELVANSTKGIANEKDLQGKRIGLTSKSSADYFFSIFSAEHGLGQDDLIIIDTPPSQIVESLTAGTVDAIATWTPLSLQAERALGGAARKWPLQDYEQSFWVLVVNRHRLPSNQALQNLLSSLLASEHFILLHEQEALEGVTRQIKGQHDLVEYEWNRSQYQIVLPAQMLASMEFRAHWLVSTKNRKIPNYLRRIYFEPLESVKSQAVSIIH